MSRKLDTAVLGAWTFFASAHAIDVCGINGLPLTPNSIRILGHFQKLKTLEHGSLCSYLDIQRGKHERVMIVSEHYLDGLYKEKFRKLAAITKVLTTVAFEIIDALAYLHSEGVVHRCLSPNCILFDSENHVKLSNYGLYFMTEGGSSVSFPIGVPKYMAPEILACGLGTPFDPKFTSGPKSDVWSLGMILVELIMEVPLWDGFALEDIFHEIFTLVKLDTSHEVVSSLFKDHNALAKMEALPKNLLLFIEACLTAIPENRPEACDLLSHTLFEDHGFTEKSRALLMPSVFLSTQQ